MLLYKQQQIKIINKRRKCIYVRGFIGLPEMAAIKICKKVHQKIREVHKNGSSRSKSSDNCK